MNKIKFLYLFLFCLNRSYLMGQKPIPLSITIEDMDLSLLDKKEQTKWRTKMLKFSVPTFANDCTPEQETFNRTVVAYGRTVIASKAFEELLSRKMREAYGKCTGDPFYSNDLETQINQVLAACRAPKSIKINCTGGGGNASTHISNYDLNKTPEFWWGAWFQGVSQCESQHNCNWDPFPWPYSQAAGIVWHELMHQYGYGHGANNSNENEAAKTNCGIPPANTTWHFQWNTIPYIVGNCVSQIMEESQKACGNIRNCPSPNQIKLVDRVGSSTCSCVNEPAQVDLVGVWKRPGDELVVVITKPTKDPVYAMSIPGRVWDHTAQLTYKGANTFTGIVERVHRGDGCTTYLSVKLQTTDNNHFTLEAKGRDGNCDIPPTYRESNTFEKILDLR